MGLQCGICKLDGRVVRGEEGVVLQQCRQGLPTSSWWVCLRNCAGVLALAPKKVWQQSFQRVEQIELQHWHSCHLPVCDSSCACPPVWMLLRRQLWHWHSCHLPVFNFFLPTT